MTPSGAVGSFPAVVFERKGARMQRLLLVCTGNTCRSPLAVVFARRIAVREDTPVAVESAGISAVDGAPASGHAQFVARDAGADLSAHRSRRLDEALLREEIDCAVHSAKDLPGTMPGGIDWFWLPWHEDARDAVILAPGCTRSDLPPDPVVGISSDRRETWCKQQFPKARMKPIRGNIEERLAQLDAGDYDMILMASTCGTASRNGSPSLNSRPRMDRDSWRLRFALMISA